MAAQRFLNNFDWAFLGPVTASTHVGFESTIGKGILQISDAASALLTTLTGGDWYVLTAYKRSGSVESAIEIIKVLGVNEVAYAAPGECRIRVERAHEGSALQTYVAGDLISMRITAGGLNNLASDAEVAAALALKIDAGTKDASGGVPGLTLFKLNLRNAANTFTSWFTTAATAARTWTMPDKDGTVAFIEDFASLQPLDATLTAIANDSLGAFSYRNKIINGNFDIWQRGTIFDNSASYTADRWVLSGSPSAGRATSRQAFSAADATTYNARHYLRLDASAQATSDNRLLQSIEGVALAGKVVTLSLWAKANAAGLTLSPSVRTYADSSATYNIVAPAGQTINTTWTKHTFTFTVTALPALTVTDSARLFLTLQFSNTANIFDVAQVQIEEGAVATAFEQRPVEAELALCQRYYFRCVPTSGMAISGVGYSTSTQQMHGSTAFPVTMRIAPTALEQSGSAADYGVSRGGAAVATVCSATPAFASAVREGAFTVFTVASGLVNGSAGAGYSVAAAGFLAWSAEL